MSIKYLNLSGLEDLWINIKNYILSKIPTKTSELTNDSGYLTSHQSLANYVTLNGAQTISGKKLFTASAIQLDNVTSMYGSTMFIDTSASAPRGEFPAETHRVGRIYIGDSTSYNGAWFIVDPIISTNKAVYRMVTTNPDNTDSTRFSITWDSTETGARCRKNVSTGDLLPYANNTYNLGSNNQKWDIGYIHNLIGSNKENASEDANNYYSTTSGSHMTFYTTTNGGTKLSNVPAAVNTQLESRTIRYLSASDWNVEQICHNTNGLYYRKGNNNGWGDWKTFAFTDSNITGKASNVTGTVAIANGGTGATTRLNAVKALTNEAVSSPTHFLAITTNWGKAGYTTVAQAKTVLGITGDIVSHNASEFLTSHQSLSSCVKNVVTNNQTIKSTAITRGTAPSSAQTFGIAFTDNNNKYIGNVHGQFATDKSTYVGLYAYKGSTTSNGDNAYVRVGYDASGNVYTSAPTPATADNSTQIATTAFVKAQGYLTSHQSLANYVTTNTDQTISGVKSFSDNISTKKIISNVAQLQINARSSADSVAIIAGANASDGSGIWLYGKDNATGSDCRIQIYNTTKSRYERVDLVGSQFLPNPSGELDCGGTSNKWKSVYATNYYYGNDNVEFSTKFVTTDTDQSISGIKSHSKHISILGDYVGNESSTNGRSCLYLKANRDTDGKSGLYVTKYRQNVAQGSMGNSNVVFLSHDILENGTRTNAGFVESYSNWANNVPGGVSIYSTIATRNLGINTKPWTNAYITNLTLNGHLFNPASTTGNIGDIVFAGAYFRAINGTQDLALIASGNALYLAGFTGAALVFSTSTSNLPGTWASLGKGKPATTTENGGAMYTCLWKRIS